MTERELQQLVGGNLKRLRLQQGLYQDQFAAKIGMSYHSYRGLEKGKSLPNVKSMVKLINGLDIAPMELFR